MTVLGLSIPGILDAARFQLVANKGVGTYRMIYQAMNACPNGPTGCQICNYPAGRIGWHPQPIEQVDVDVQGLVRGAWGKPNLVPNRWRLTPVTLVVDGQEYGEGDGFSIRGREIHWHEDAPVGDQGRFGLQYRAFREDWVSVQHAYVDFAGGPRQAEKSLNLKWGQVDQGMIAVTVPATSAGYRLTQSDRFIPVDAEMEFDATLDTRAGDTHCRHHFVSEIVKAYGLDETQTREVEVLGVGYDFRRGRFTLPKGPLPPKLVVKYRAAPIYTVFLDQGEFRNQHSQLHGKLVVLQREEIAR
ncbi:hypothetical protein [Deinococcus sp. S9]|uniref:hypothetical protein n=1 Tax=Deinococcus sp. S9 TaxID=2545754 RepID=UPI0010561661|nr:hypothetical protein [Deinococcus sp. S9]TDE85581.1 hypothetical protein E0686_11255 [Deinococcus sp. S9]